MLGILAALPGQALALPVRPQQLVTRTWDRPDGLQAIAQGPDGMLWLATKAGLVRFDGERFVDVDVGQEMGQPSTWVRRAFASRDGSVWLATGAGSLALTAEPGVRVLARHGQPSAGLLRLAPYRPATAPGRLVHHSTANGLPSPWVWALAEEPRGGLWIGTERGLARLTDGKWQRFSRGDGLPADLVTALAIAPDGALLVGTSRGVVVRRGERFAPTPIDEPVLAVAQDGAGRLWAAGHRRLLRVDPGGGVRVFPLETTRGLAVDADDNLWTAEGQVFSAGEPVPDRLLSPDLQASGLLADREGSVWLTLQEGRLLQLSAPLIRSYGPEDGLPGLVAFSVLAARDGSIYTATQGGVARLAGGTWTVWRDGPGVGWGWKNLAEGAAGAPNAGIWISSGRLSHGGPDGFRMVRHTDPPLPEITFPSVVAARNGDLWLAQSETGVFRLPGARLEGPSQRWSPADGLCSADLTHGFEASDGSIWYATEYGASNTGPTRIKDGRARCYGVADGLPSAQVGAIAEDREGTIWLGTGWGAGLVRFQNERFTTVPAARGLPRASITGILDDGRDHLWIASEAGVWRAPKADLHRCADGACGGVRATIYGREEGMRTAESTGAFHPNIVLDGEGNVWVATLKGLTVFPPPERMQRPVLTPTVVEILIDGVPIDVTDQVRLGPLHEELVVRYAGASFIGQGRLRLQHRLSPFDADWVNGSPAVAYYRRLPAGHYTLEIRAGSETGPVRRLNIQAEPPFWRSRTFLFTVAALVGSAGFVLYRLRIARLELQHRAASDERARIARDLHDGLAQKLTAIGLLTDSVRQDAGQGAAEAQLQQMRQILGAAHAELRGAIWDMRQGSGGSSCLETSIRAVLAEVAVPPSTAVTVRTSGSALPVSGILAHEVPLVIKEALTNVVRHARARNVEIGVLSDGEGLHAWVRDDGCGIPPARLARPEGAYGILGMHERARRVGGTLTTNSGLGGGTEVSLFVPGHAERSRP